MSKGENDALALNAEREKAALAREAEEQKEKEKAPANEKGQEPMDNIGGGANAKWLEDDLDKKKDIAKEFSQFKDQYKALFDKDGKGPAEAHDMAGYPGGRIGPMVNTPHGPGVQVTFPDTEAGNKAKADFIQHCHDNGVDLRDAAGKPIKPPEKPGQGQEEARGREEVKEQERKEPPKPTPDKDKEAPAPQAQANPQEQAAAGQKPIPPTPAAVPKAPVQAQAGPSASAIPPTPAAVPKAPVQAQAGPSASAIPPTPSVNPQAQPHAGPAAPQGQPQAPAQGQGGPAQGGQPEGAGSPQQEPEKKGFFGKLVDAVKNIVKKVVDLVSSLVGSNGDKKSDKGAGATPSAPGQQKPGGQAQGPNQQPQQQQESPEARKQFDAMRNILSNGGNIPPAPAAVAPSASPNASKGPAAGAGLG